MKSILSSVLIALIVCLNFNAFSRNPVNIKNSEKANPARMDAEACFPATASTELYVNNVRTVIMTGGDMWWDLKSVPKYIIPATGKTCSMFSASLWIGGIDINGQLKVCAQTYRNSGNDFWPGPLTTDGTASVDATTCKKYDRHFAITRNEVAQFVTDASKVTQVIKEWPGNGDVTKGQDQFLAPFVDKNGDGIYNWQDGDYPAFDIDGKNPCSDNMLFGDKTLWWVFNDKGNVHTQTNGSPIGMEIRAQAFAFSTNDDINNMTFYNYKLINRSTYTLTQTFFSQWIDTDIGDAQDDFVGCDVTRGLAYGYNGDDYDGTGLETHYGANPPACGSDFFQGPYMDKDGIDNPAYSATMTYKNDQYTLASINGEGFGDGIVDNERFGMRRFVYHSNPSYGNPNNAITDPSTAIEYYNLLRSIWKDGTKMLYGGTGHYSDPKAKGPECDYMFPDDTDPRGWGTGGVPQAPWSEKTNNNKPGDRRYMQSAGPFTLEPGAVNYITVGIPWARASAGGAWASVQLLKVADDKCQRLFDNCFKVVNGPDAPDLTITELNRKLILTLSNENVLSNNYHEKYKEFDFNIVTPADYRTAHNGKGYDSLYRFEGYQIYQLANANVSVSDLHDVSLARLVAQCDIKNGISKLINYTHDASLNANVPVQEVDGADKGISHTFVVSEDLFSTGDKSLVNNKKYYFIAIAYAYNQYLPYSDDPTILNGLLGQKTPYKASRKSATGQILPVSAVPHIPEAENNGTIMQSDYGFGPKITRIEGQGNGGQILELTDASINKILSDGKILTPEYKNSEGPVNVKVVDPLNVLGGDFTLKFLPTKTTSDPTIGLNEAGWELDFIPNGGNAQNRKVWFSDKSIKVANEQVIPEVGLSI
ncbi:MAG: T9SS C-terminal target domain-containing protein, partial [Bacteroidota bacterium]|nr:T9SS C-terminal target domain-containing protein [Bacteroidota bacterium]